jgi:hypothetical protein
MPLIEYLSPEYGLLQVEYEIHQGDTKKYANVTSAHNSAGINFWPLPPLEEEEVLEILSDELNKVEE